MVISKNLAYIIWKQTEQVYTWLNSVKTLNQMRPRNTKANQTN